MGLEQFYFIVSSSNQSASFLFEVQIAIFYIIDRFYPLTGRHRYKCLMMTLNEPDDDVNGIFCIQEHF